MPVSRVARPLASAGGGVLQQVGHVIRLLLRTIGGGPNAPSSLTYLGLVIVVGLALLGIVIGIWRLYLKRREPTTPPAPDQDSPAEPSTIARDPSPAGGRPGTESPLAGLQRILPGTIDKDTSSGFNRTAASDVDLDEVSDERFDRAVSILQQEGRETSRENIREQVAHLIDFEDADPEDFRIGLVRDATSQAQLDQASVAPPSMVLDDPTTIFRNGEYIRILTPSSPPETVTGGWLTPLTTTNLDVRVSYQFEPRDPTTVRGKLQNRLTELQLTLSRKEQKGASDYHEDWNRRQELDRLLNRLSEGSTRLYDAAIYVEVAAPSRNGLEESTRRVQQLVADRDVELVPLEFRQLESQNAIAPVVDDPIKNSSLIEHDAAATLFNAVEPAIADPDGVLYGFDETSNPVIVDRFSLSGFSKVVTGKVGSGKTFSAKWALLGQLLIDPEFTAIAFDPTGDDFVDFAELLGGEVITFGGDVTINPLEINQGTGVAEDPYRDKLRSVTGMIRTFYDQSDDSLSAEDAGLVQQVIHLAYLMYGITTDPATHNRKNPTIQDVLDIFNGLAEGKAPMEFVTSRGDAKDLPRNERDELDELVDEVTDRLQVKAGGSGNIQQKANGLLRALEAFQPNGVAANLNGETNVDLGGSRIIAFDMSAFQDTQQAPVLQHVMLDWSYQRARETPQTIEVLFEEVHYLLDQPSARALIGLFTRHSRHFNAGLTLISQTAEEFMRETDDSHSPRAIYDQCDIKQLFYQESVSDDVIDYYNLSPGEVQSIRNFARGQVADYSECLLSVSGEARRQVELHLPEFIVNLVANPQAVGEALIDIEGEEVVTGQPSGEPGRIPADELTVSMEGERTEANTPPGPGGNTATQTAGAQEPAPNIDSSSQGEPHDAPDEGPASQVEPNPDSEGETKPSTEPPGDVDSESDTDSENTDSTDDPLMGGNQ